MRVRTSVREVLGRVAVNPLSCPTGDAECLLGRSGGGLPQERQARVWKKPISAPYTLLRFTRTSQRVILGAPVTHSFLPFMHHGKKAKNPIPRELMPNGIVVGVYVERSGGMVMRAKSSGYDIGRKTIEPLHANRIDWPTDDHARAREGLEELARLSAEMGGNELTSISIAGYGPFLSLKRSNLDGNFGQMHSVSDGPLTGTNIFETFHRKISTSASNPGAFITVYTDAEACAIGEAMTRELRDDQLLAFFLVTEGIGMGLVQGRRILSSALHSEVGMLAVRWKSEDPLKPDKASTDYARSLSEMADNKALRKRFEAKYRKNPTDDLLRKSSNSALWDFRAYYLAQACLACTVILPPHQIVIGADIDDNKRSIANRIRLYFSDFLKVRRTDGKAVLEFEELNKESYIDDMKPVPGTRDPTSLRTKGVIGMCYAAATAERGAVMHNVENKSRGLH